MVSDPYAELIPKKEEADPYAALIPAKRKSTKRRDVVADVATKLWSGTKAVGAGVASPQVRNVAVKPKPKSKPVSAGVGGNVEGVGVSGKVKEETDSRKIVGQGVIDIIEGKADVANVVQTLKNIPAAVAGQSQETAHQTVKPLASVIPAKGIWGDSLKAFEDSPVHEHKVFAATLKNLDPSQIPGFIASLTAPSGAKEMGEHVEGLIQRIGKGDEEALVEMRGMIHALVLGGVFEGVGGVRAFAGIKGPKATPKAAPKTLEAPEVPGVASASRRVDEFRKANPGVEFDVKGQIDGRPVIRTREAGGQPKPKAPEVQPPVETFDPYAALIPEQSQTGPGPTIPVASQTTVPPVVEPPAVIEPPTPPATTELPKIEPQPGQGTALANRATNVVRRLIGKPEFTKPGRESLEVTAANAVAKGYDRPENALVRADEVLAGGRALDHEETVGMASAVDELLEQHEYFGNEYLKTAEKGGDIELANRMADLTDKIDRMTRAGNVAGTEWGRTGAARQAVMKADGSLAGVLSRRQRLVQRPLTSDELTAAKREAAELQKLVTERDKRVAELEADATNKAAQQAIIDEQSKRITELETQMAGAPRDVTASRARSTAQVQKIDARIKDVSERLKAKWAENKPDSLVSSSLFGIDIAAQEAARLATVVPEILELSALHAQKGAVKLADNTRAVVEHLRSLGIKDISENGIAGVLAGKIKTEGIKADPSDYQVLKSEARAVFAEAAEQRRQQARLIEQKSREIKEKFMRDEKAKALAALKEERTQLQAEDKAAREAEKEFWKDVQRKERAHQAEVTAQKRADRAAYIQWWKEKGSNFQRMLEYAERQEARAAAGAEKAAATAARKEAEQALRESQAAFNKEQRRLASLDRKEAVRRWRASTAAQRAGSLNRIDRLQEKLDIFDSEGIIKGAQEKLKQKEDPIVRDLTIKEASLRNRMHKNEMDMKAKAEFDALDPTQKFIRRWNPWNAMRSVVASFDVSFPLNQGSMALLSDPRSWGRGAKASFRSLAEAGYDNVMAEIRAQKDWYEKATAANLFEEGSNLADIFGADSVSRIPGISHSQLAYQGGANAMRFELFKAWSDLAERTGGKPLTLEDYKAISKEVKSWTGQGVLGSGEGAQRFGKAFFALRYRMSQFETAFGAPLVRTWKHGADTKNWGPFKVMLAKYAQAYGTAIGTVVIANEVLRRTTDGQMYIEINPTATNFGRLVRHVGQTTQTWDLLPPAMRMYGLTSRVIQGARVTMGGTLQDGKDFANKGLRKEMLSDFWTNGLHPIPAFFWNYWEAQDRPDKKMFGKSFDLSEPGDFAIDQGMGMAPISFQTWKEIWENDDLSLMEKILASGLAPVISSNTVRRRG